MEEKFQKQIQKLNNINQLYEEIEKGRAATKREIKERQELEWKKFREHIQNNFIEYVLDLFEELITKYGKKVSDITFSESTKDVSLIGVQPPSTNSKASFGQRIFIANSDYYYYSFYYTDASDSYKKVYLDYAKFYSDYVPQDDLAHVIVPDFSRPNSSHFKFAEPNYKLYISDLYSLFLAVCVNYKYEEHYSPGTEDSWPSSKYNCNIDDKMFISLSVLDDFREGSLRSMTVEL